MKRKILLSALLALLPALPLGMASAAPAAPISQGDEFFIVSSIDVTHGRIILKRPTDVTAVVRVTAATQIRDEQGKALRLTDLRAGDTAWIATTRDPAGELTAFTIRLGPMTVEELQRRYPSAG
jgi:hypothetical protein